MSRGSPGPITRTRPPVVGRSPGTHGTSTVPSTPVSTVASWGLGLASLYPGVRVARGGWWLGKGIYNFARSPRGIGWGLKAYKWTVGPTAAYLSFTSLWEARGPEKKIGFRFGTEGGVMPIGLIPGIRQSGLGTRGTSTIPVPTFGFGFTAVPSSEPRFTLQATRGKSFQEIYGFDSDTSRGGLSVQSSQHRGQHKRGPSSPTPSAPSGTQGLSSAERVSGGGTKGSRPRRRGSSSRHTRSTLRVTPQCPVHNVRHWCNVTRKIRFGS